ncbi:hypothetical protein UFOVP22_11 [uncultured Caudovirales phage]|uniref:Uncharacterized protein n=1 Tax=uncultured Caudovirales phage TaxID=2100421 RepID=A0A6J5T837_9CAUD|nr:hypothetical protein UFOVP22_11 [uncultured Caudovirales phage]
MARIDRYDFPVANAINPLTKKPIYGDPLSIVGAVAGPLIGGLMAPDTPQAQQAPGFTPYGVSTGYGTSKFDTTGKTAGYTLTPEMQAFRDKYYGAATAAMPTAGQTAYANQVRDYGQGVFNQAAGMNTDQMTQDYYNKQLALLEPGRAQESSNLSDKMFGTGRTGLGVGMGQGYVNPQQYALAQAREQANAGLALTAEDRARSIQNNQLTQGLNLYGLGTSMATSPYDTANQLFGYGSNIENLGMGALNTGSNIGTMSAQAGAQAAGVNNAANQQSYLNNLSQANAYGNAAQQAIGGFGKLYSANTSTPYIPGVYDVLGASNYQPVGGPGIKF